jgi:hypothetical protein
VLWTTDRLMPRLRMSGGIPLLAVYAFKAFTGSDLPLPLSVTCLGVGVRL